MHTSVTLDIAAAVSRVWRALTTPDEVETWAGVTAVSLPPTYPAAGDYARWWDRGVLLHDYIVAVEPERTLESRLERGSDLVIERYALRAGGGATRLRATWRGHPRLAGNERSMHVLKRWCETVR